MGFSVGLVGLPNAGKTTLFNALTAAKAEVGAYPFTTVGRNVGVIVVPDERLEVIAAVTRSAKVSPTWLEVVDIAGLVRGAHRGEGLGNQFLGHIREVDLVAHVVRCFTGDRVSHVEGETDPLRDADIVDTEMALADLETVGRHLEHARRKAKSGSPADQAEALFLERVWGALAKGVPVRAMKLDPVEVRVLRDLFLLTAKPVVYVGNVDEADYHLALRGEGPPGWVSLAARAAREGSPAVPVCAAIEADLMALPPEERARWRQELGPATEGGAALIRAAYRHLDLITFYTVNENEAKAHTLSRGATAVQAAGKVHSDMEKGFVRAEVVGWQDLERAGSMAAARQKGLVRVEGRDYVVRDGDVMYFRFVPPS